MTAADAPQSEPRERRRGLLLLAVKLAISAALIWLVMRSFEAREFTAHLADVSLAGLVGALLLALVAAPLQAVRWKCVLRVARVPMPFPRALAIIFIGHFFNQTLPSSVGGDAMRIWCTYRAGVPLSQATATVLVDRLLTLAALLAVSGMMLPWLLDLLPEASARAGLVSVVLAGLGGFGAMIVLGRVPRFLLRFRAARAIDAVTGLLRAVALDPRNGAFAILLSVIGYILFGLIAWRLFGAIGVHVSLLHCVLLLPPVLVVTVIPVSVAGWGVREGAMVVAFGFVGVPAQAAFAVSVLFGLTVAVAALPGALLWLRSARAGALRPAR